MRNNAAVARAHAMIARYLDRRQLYSFQIAGQPAADLRLIIVIPCFDEPDITGVLESLGDCERPCGEVEILVVINAPRGAPAKALRANEAAREASIAWASARAPDWLRCHVIWHPDLSASRAGVGMARKIGMDEAASRLSASRRGDGVIASLDADCRVAPNYARAIVDAFHRRSSCPGMSIYFEHPLGAAEGDALSAAVAEYELHLRCYVAGQRLARFPYAFHTIGSAMACRASAYAAQGGMNRRQGGEDFYFIQKLVNLGHYRTLNDTVVFPGVRLSQRVPFGTGQAAGRLLRDRRGLMTYDPLVYRDLGRFSLTVADLQSIDPEQLACRWSLAMRQFLDAQRFANAIGEIRANVARPAAFRRRVLCWFNAFRFMKFAQFASRHHYPRLPVARAAQALALSLGYPDSPDCPRELLTRFRALDRLAPTCANGFGDLDNSI
jgi:hypothetical protein